MNYNEQNVARQSSCTLLICCIHVVWQVKTKTGFFKQAKKAYPMFPCKEEKIKWDEYGEFIK